jgi:sensor histidine kinase YesM
MANIFSVASKSICKMITVIDRVSDIALNITDAGVAGSEIVKEQVEGYRDTERQLIQAKLEMTKQKMAHLKANGKALTQDNLDEIEL